MAKLPQHGGEMKGSFGKKTDMKLKQHGGEGKAMGKKSDMGLLLKKKGMEYCGPGRYLSISK